MKQSIRLSCSAAILVAAIVTGGVARGAITYNAENQPISITDLQVGDTVYDVAIQYGGSFDSVYGDYLNPTPVPTFWGNEAGARVAIQAMAEALNADGAADPTVSTFIPVVDSSGDWFAGPYIDGVAVEFSADSGAYIFNPPNEGYRMEALGDYGYGWTTFTAVPEPTTCALLIAGGLPMAMMLKRYRRN